MFESKVKRDICSRPIPMVFKPMMNVHLLDRLQGSFFVPLIWPLPLSLILREKRLVRPSLPPLVRLRTASDVDE